MKKYSFKRPRKPIRRVKKRVVKRKLYAKRPVLKKKLKLNSVRVKNDGINATYDHSYNRMTKFMYDMKKRFYSGQRNTYQLLSTYQISSGSVGGVQKALSLSMFANPDLYNATASVNQQYSGTAGTITATRRTYFENYHADYTMTNSSNAQLMVDIYHFVCKRDVSLTPTALWQQGIQDEQNSSVSAAYNVWGASPLESLSLNSFYRCKRITHVTLQPGQIHNHRVSINKHCPLNNEMINSQNVSQQTNMKYWAEYIVLVTRGVPCTSAVAGVLSTTAYNLDIIQNETYTLKYIADNDYTYSFGASTFGVNNTGFVYNQGSGATVAPTAI